jgi:hypothetical protein
MRKSAVVAGLLAPLLLGGASGCRSCDEMGCTDSLRVTSEVMRPGQTIEVCAGGSCIFAEPKGGVSFTQMTPPPARATEVIVRVYENGVLAVEQRQDRTVADFRPNGGWCPPKCKVVDVLVGERGFS